jgi:hypothetical protein
MARDQRFQLIAAGRRTPTCPLPCPFVPLDIAAADLAPRLREHAADLVIHCAGPFAPERYAVVEAALACGSHYLDLAESRHYVVGIGRFDALARHAGLSVLSGVSSVPALSSAVAAAYRSEFSCLDAIDVGISSSERVPGKGAVCGVLEQCGQPLPAQLGRGAENAAWTDRFRVNLPLPVGPRVVASCDVPDLALLPAGISGLRRVTFRAGVASPWLMCGLRAFARLRRRGWISRPDAWAAPMAAAARLFYPFGNGSSGMFVRLSGRSADGSPLVVCWQLVARDNQGVQVPARGVVAMADRLLGNAVPAGARPCFMELTVEEYLGRDLPVTTRVDRLEGEAARRDEMRWCRA